MTTGAESLNYHLKKYFFHPTVVHFLQYLSFKRKVKAQEKMRRKFLKNVHHLWHHKGAPLEINQANCHSQCKCIKLWLEGHCPELSQITLRILRTLTWIFLLFLHNKCWSTLILCQAPISLLIFNPFRQHPILGIYN